MLITNKPFVKSIYMDELTFDTKIPLNEFLIEDDSLSEIQITRSTKKFDHDLRIAIAQITTDPGCIEQNTQKIISCIKQAKEARADVIAFSELAISGYACMDLFYHPEYLKDSLEALQQIKEHTQGITALIGFPDNEFEKKRPGNRPEVYNSAAVIKDRKIEGIVDKTHLPNYEIFYEQNHFKKGRQNKPIEVNGVQIGIPICEDSWAEVENYPYNPNQDLIDQGADIIINLSASPFHIGKQLRREELIKGIATKYEVPVVYSNLVGGFDAFEGEVIFDGRSLVANSDGDIIAKGSAFKEELIIVDIQKKESLEIEEMLPVAEMHEALVLGTREYYRRICAPDKANIEKAIIGLSGGIDSAVVAEIASKALGGENVIGVMLKTKYTKEQSIIDAREVAKANGIDFRVIDIQDQVDATLESLAKGDPELKAHQENKSDKDVSEENVQARLRMLNLMYYANSVNGIVLNTGNKTELALNNCTIYGDMVGGFSVLADVDKDRVYELARYANEQAGKPIIPISTIEKVPTAELKEDQDDSDVMGDDPRKLAPMVREIIESSLTVKQTIEKYSNEFSEELIRSIFFKLDASEWKRRQAAPGIRVTSHAFGNGRKVPIGHGYRK